MQILLIMLGAICISDTLLMSLYARPDVGIKAPGVLGIPLLVMGVFYHYISEFLRFGPVKWTIVALYSIPVLIILVKTVQAALIRMRTPDGTEGADVVIVLGLNTQKNVISTELKKRVERAYTYLCQNSKTIAVLTGSVDEGEIRSEADIMYEYLISLGIEPSRVIKEEKATTTVENFTYSMKLMEERFDKGYKAVFVTTSYHVKRAEYTARKYGYSIRGIASPGVWFKLPNDFLREFIVWAKLKHDGII